MQERIKIALLVFLMLLLWMPLLQRMTRFFKEPELKGAYEKPMPPRFSLEDIKSGKFQKQVEDYENYNFGFRGLFVKIKNSVEYILFKEITPIDQIEGMNGYIYSHGSVERFFGHSYNGAEKNDSTLFKINFLKEETENRGRHFLAVIVPSKESVIPENLPAAYHDAPKQHSDYDDFISGYQRYHIPFIDLCSYFRNLRDTCPYPLFTKTGFHWSVYGASLAQDTLLKYIQHYLPEPMPSYIRTGVEWSDTARESEADFETPMNLLFSLQQSSYVYPKIEMVQSSLKNHRPKVIIIGDSFFWQIKDLKKLQYIFSEDSRYWYYFSKAVALSDIAGCEIMDVNIIKELESADFILLVGSIGTFNDFPFGVTDYYYNKMMLEISIREYIRNNADYMKIISASKTRNRSVDYLVAEESRHIVEDKKIFHLKAANDKFVSADESRNNIVIADRNHALAWETFSLLQLGNNKCAIYSHTNKFICTKLNRLTQVTATSEAMGAREIFTMVMVDGTHVALKASNNKYLSLDEKSLRLFASGDSIGKQEKFKLLIE